MNRQQRRQQQKAAMKARGETYADVLAKRQIGRETLRMAMEDEAVGLAADIKTQRMLWAVVVALNEKYDWGPKRTRDLMEAMDLVLADFETMKEKHGDEYAEEKLRERASKVSGIDVKYAHEAEIEAYQKIKAEEVANNG